MKTIWMLSLLWMIPMAALPQQLNYEVVKGGKVIGRMDVTRVKYDSLEDIQIESQVNFKLLLTLTVEFKSTETFQQGILQKGTSFNTLNGSTQRSVKTQKNTQGYTLYYEGVPNILSAREIKYTVSRLYFEEPIGGKKAFSQTFGEHFSFTKISDGYYKMTTPDGDNYYTYMNGVVTEVKVVRDYATYYFVMKPDCLAKVKKEGSQAFYR